MKLSNYGYNIFRLKSVHCTNLRRANLISDSISFVHQGWFSLISFSIKIVNLNITRKKDKKTKSCYVYIDLVAYIS